MPIEKLPDQNQSINVIKIIRCRNCGNERQITDQWLKEVSSKLSENNSNINESEITKYLYRLYCSKCKGRDTEITSTSKQNEPDPEAMNFNQAALETKKNLDGESYLAALERKKERDKQAGGIPEYEEGAPRAEWGTREDYKKMRGGDFGDMMRRQNE
ncbi:MAG: hypothetical protein KJ663_04080 [Proteobacteria bacterium]|nr:hypothetical protein [Pseudomonadota bacterium]